MFFFFFWIVKNLFPKKGNAPTNKEQYNEPKRLPLARNKAIKTKPHKQGKPSITTQLSVDVICFFSVVCLCPGCGLKFLDCVVVNQVFLVAGCCPGP